MKNLFYILFILFFISSCSETDNGLDIDNDKDKDIILPKLNTEKKEGNIFENMLFDIRFENESTKICDSIVWKVSNLNGSFKVLENIDNGDSSHYFITTLWSFPFSFPEEYKIFLIGYINDRIIYGDTLSIRILNNKDFLGYNWNDVIDDEANVDVGYTDVFEAGYRFITSRVIHNNIPSIELFLDIYSSDYIELEQANEKILFDYISSLYSSPTYSTNDGDILLEKYNNLFNYKEEGMYPKNIWITSK